MHRQLVAIMFTDIVGYTAMMQYDERLAIAAVNRHQQIVEKFAEEHGGEVLQYYGDGSLSIFSSAVEALQCAMEIQKALAEKTNDFSAVPLRIGMHVGEILRQDGNVFGDGVNLASRIESLGQAGTVLFSRNLWEKIKNLPEFETASLGSFEFKNVEDPMEVFALANRGFPVPDRKSISGKLKIPSTPEKKQLEKNPGVRSQLAFLVFLAASIFLYLNLGTILRFIQVEEERRIAVMPFINVSEHTEDYLADGITIDIISELANIDEFRISSITSSFAYRNEAKNTKAIAEELGVQYLVEGSIESIGNALKIAVNLVDASMDDHIWGREYNSFSTSIGDIQNDIARQIAATFKVPISSREKQRIESGSISNFNAYKLFLEARAENRKLSRDAFNRSIELSEQVIALESGFAQAYTLIAWNYLLLSVPAYGGRLEPLHAQRLALPYAKKSIELNPELSDSYLVLGAVHNLSLDFANAEFYFDQGMKLARWPEHPTNYCYCTYIQFLIGNRRFAEALDVAQKVKRIDPAYVFVYHDLGIIYVGQEQPTKAIGAFQEALTYLDIPVLHYYLGWAYYHAQDSERAIHEFETAIAQSDIPLALAPAFLAILYSQRGDTAKSDLIIKELNQRRLQGESNMALALGIIAAGRHNDEEAIVWLEESYLKRDPLFYMINVDPHFYPIYKNDRFQDLLERVGFQQFKN